MSPSDQSHAKGLKNPQPRGGNAHGKAKEPTLFRWSFDLVALLAMISTVLATAFTGASSFDARNDANRINAFGCRSRMAAKRSSP
jgi:hypothetical protein